MNFCRSHFKTILLFFACLNCFVSAATAEIMLPIKAGNSGLYGFIDQHGKLVIEPQFEDAARFNNGLAPVHHEGVWYFIDNTGTNVFARTFAEVKVFSEGLAAVKENRLWGYIDQSGKLVIDFKFEEAYPFSEGLACVQTGKKEDGNAKYGYIDPSGKFVIDPIFKFYDNQFFSWPTGFAEGLASAWLERADGSARVGYFDKSGKTVIDPNFVSAAEFCDDLAPVTTNDAIEGGARFIRKDGSFAFPQEYSVTARFSDGLAPVSVMSDGNDETSWGYVDKSGKLAIKPQFAFAEPFKNGFARVFIGDFSNEAYIDTTGKILTSSAQLTSQSSQAYQQPLLPDDFACSSHLPPSKSGKTDYKPANVCDGNNYTAWIEGNSNNGTGEWIELRYEALCTFKKLIFKTGYQKKNRQGTSLFRKNLRPARIKVTSDKNSIELSLSDSEDEQAFSIDLQGFNLRITILDVFKTGSEDPDCGFSEISVFGGF